MKDATRYLYICGFGRNGSTLLSYLLHSHSRIVSLGEVNGMPPRFGERHCHCGALVQDCEFWQRIRKAMQARISVDIFRESQQFDLHAEARYRGFRETYCDFLKLVIAAIGCPGLAKLMASVFRSYRIVQERINNNYILFDSVRDLTDCPILVDSSKIPIRMKLLYLERPELFKVIHMVRDGRAVVWSEVRRGADVTDRATRWVRVEKQAQTFLKSIPVSRKLLLRYEDLCADPSAELQRVCAFVGVDFETQMLRFRDVVHHDIGGSTTVREGSSDRIIYDERWRTEMPLTDLEVFRRIGGKIQKRLGYEI